MDDLYINKGKAFVDFMLLQQQWSGVDKIGLEKWLQNFRELDTSEQVLVYKLLTNVIYFSEKDVISVLREGIFNCVAYDSILENQKNNNFQLSGRALVNTYNTELTQSCFVPLLDNDSPYESANYVTRILVQQGIVPQNNAMYISKVPNYLKTHSIKRLIIVDDCVGSGQQLTDFWNKTKVIDNGIEMSIKDLCSKHQISANYLTLFGYDKSIDSLRKQFKDLHIYCVRYLNEQQRVFSDKSYIWKDSQERDRAKILFNDLCSTAGIPLLGYNGLDFAFIMHQTIPDWSLPLFWKENADWNLLVRRKNSNVW